MSDLIEQLEDWKNGHKARAVIIAHETGYGASVWTVSVDTESGHYSFWEGCVTDSLDQPTKDLPTIAGYPYYEEHGMKEFSIYPAHGEIWAGLKTTLAAALKVLDSEFPKK